ncbi:MAG: hypothetical protein GXY51_08210 [Bacteroidetes bacterium]|nr:hypothetical protein [Bacteroidota bacterium]
MIVFSALSLGILGFLFGGFGNLVLDKVLHVIIFFGVAFMIFYYQKQDKSRHTFKIASMVVFVLIYSALINPRLALAGIIPLGSIVLLTKGDKDATPLMDKDSPMQFWFRNIAPWKIFLVIAYCAAVFFV